VVTLTVLTLARMTSRHWPRIFTRSPFRTVMRS
jgi:hypothetical protein